MYGINVGQIPMSHDDLYGTVQELLIAWARWRWAGHGANVGFSSSAPIRRLMRTPGTANVSVAPIPEELACRVDLAVSQLKLRSDPVKGDYRWEVLTDSYLNGWPDSVIAKKRKISKSTARTARLAAENWIEGRVY